MPAGSWVEDTVFSIVTYVLKMITGEWSNVAWNWFSHFFSSPMAVLDHPLVTTLTQILIGAALGILPAIIAWKALHETFARIDGASTIPPETLIRRAMITGVAVTGTSLVAWFIGTLADLSKDVLAAIGLDINLMHEFFKLPGAPPGSVIVVTLVFAVGAIILTIQRVVIMAEFTVLITVGPLMAVGLMKEGGGTTWAVWLREVLSLVITPLIQMLVLLLFIRNYADASEPLEIGDRLASLGFLWVLYNTPRWARQLVYQVGAGGAMVNAAVSVGRFALMRQMAGAALKG